MDALHRPMSPLPHRILQILALTLIPSLLVAAGPVDPKDAEKERLILNARRSFEENNPKLLLDLFCWDRVPDQARALISRVVAASFRGNPVKTVTLTPPPADFLDAATVKDGITYRPNLPVIYQLVVALERPSRQGVMKFPVGERDGRLMIANMAPVAEAVPAKKKD
jgi:hypothetical protein